VGGLPRHAGDPVALAPGPDGGFDDLGIFRLEDVVETDGEPRVPVADEELHRTICLGQVADQVPGNWVTKPLSGCLVIPRR
jgi:hypothetical protein